MRLLYIDIDSLRPDHLGSYGYARNTSPNIDSVAREGVRFENYFASDAPCLPSRTALYSGRFGFQTGVVGHGGTAAQPRIEGPRRGFTDAFGSQSLPRQLQKAGFHTALISTFAQRHAAHAFTAGFNEVHDSGRGGMESAHEVLAVATPWLGARATTDRWFLHVNFWDPHTPYRAPEAFGEPFARDPLPSWITPEVLARHQKLTGPHTALDIGMYGAQSEGAPDWPRQPWSLKTPDDLRRLIDGYDTGVRYADAAVGTLIDTLKKAGVYEDTAVIVSADHGENLGELGIYAEHATADVATCRVPLIVKWPKGKTGVDTAFHYGIDFAPTLAELLGIPSQPLWDGRSFSSAIGGGAPAAAREELILSQGAHVAQRSVRWANWLYIRTTHDGFHLFPEEQLFDVAADPHEEHNVAADHPEVVHEGAWRLARWQAEQLRTLAARTGSATDPLQTVTSEGGPYHARLLSPGDPGSPEGLLKYIARLEATGRREGAAALRKRLQPL